MLISLFKKFIGKEIIIKEYNANKKHIKTGSKKLFFLFMAFLLNRISNKE